MDDEDPVVQAAGAMLAEIEKEEEAIQNSILTRLTIIYIKIQIFVLLVYPYHC